MMSGAALPLGRRHVRVPGLAGCAGELGNKKPVAESGG